MWPQRPDGAATGGLLSLANWLGCDSCAQTDAGSRQKTSRLKGWFSFYYSPQDFRQQSERFRGGNSAIPHLFM